MTLGVAFMAGTLVLTDTIGQTFNDLSAGVYKGTDAEVRAKAVFTGPAMGGGDQRPLISDSLVQSLRRVPGVAADEGSAMGYTRLIGKNGKALGNPAAGAPTLGGNWNQVSQLNPWTLVAGHPPQAADQVVIDKKSATDGHLRVGDITTVLALGPPQRFQVVGIVKFGTADSPGGASVALFTTPVAQRLVAAPGKVTSILFVAKPGVSQQQLASNLQTALPHGMEAVTGATVTKEMQDRSSRLWLLQHVHDDLRGHRAAGRRIHDLQHVLDHGGAADPGERPAAGAGREQAPGARLGARGSGGRRRHRVGRRAGSGNRRGGGPEGPAQRARVAWLAHRAASCSARGRSSWLAWPGCW